MAEFHFLRPWWLALVPVGLALAWLLLRGGGAGAGWRTVVDRALQPYVLAEPETFGERRWLMAAALAALVVAAVALAGPTWERLPVPAFRSEEALVVALDLSRSMDAADVQPSRLGRARLKLLSLLERRTGGQTALVAFSAHAFTVTPLTTDTRTVSSLVTALSSDIMPSRGSRPVAGIAKAASLLRQGGAGRGEILLITDAEVGPAEIDAARAAREEGFRVHVLAVGTEQGAPIPEQGGGFLTDRAGRVVVPQVSFGALRRLADAGGGRFAALAADDRDLDQLFPGDTPALGAVPQDEAEETLADVWRDAGVWVAVLLLPLLAAGFRRGWVASIACAVLLAPVGDAEAFEWSSLWRRADQRGLERLQSGDAERAAELFVDPEWRSAAQFRAERFAESAATLDGLDTADSHYNRGTALAKAGQVEPAIGALERALELDAEHEDARFNLELLREFNEQNQQNQQPENAGEESQGGEEQQAGDGSTGEQGQEQGEQANEGEGEEQERDGGAQSAQSSGDPSDREGDGSDDQQSADGEPSDQDERQAADGESEADGGGEPEALAMDTEEWASEQAAEQWLRRIPQDPGGLLRRKFLYQYQRLGIDQDGNYVWPGDETQPW